MIFSMSPSGGQSGSNVPSIGEAPGELVDFMVWEDCPSDDPDQMSNRIQAGSLHC